MNFQQEHEILRGISLFAEMPTGKLKLIAFTSERLRYRAGEVVFEAGDVTDSIYVIISGEVEVRITTEGGVLVMDTISRHGIFGEIGMVSDVLRTATIAAVGDLEVLKIGKTFFLQLITDNPAIARILMNELGLRLARALKIIARVPREEIEKIVVEIDQNGKT